MKRPVRVVLVIAAIQITLVGIYWFIEGRRSSDRSVDAELGTAPPERVDGLMPLLSLRAHDGTRHELRARPTLVHFWATWCPPCRRELPGLLAVPSQHDVDVVAVALDKSWDQVDRFLGDMDASNVVLAGSEDVDRALGVRTLPVTFLVEADGRLALRFDGARDWTDEAFVRTYVEERVHGR